MERGLEITFTVADKDERRIVEALANVVGNEFLREFNVDWRIFRVDKGEDRFYKVCFIGKKLSRLHPLIEERVKKRFDELSKYQKDVLLKRFNTEKTKTSFKLRPVRDIREEYDLWNDNFWQYF